VDIKGNVTDLIQWKGGESVLTQADYTAGLYGKSNLLALINGDPYLVGGYFQHASLPELDRSIIHSELATDVTNLDVNRIDLTINNLGSPIDFYTAYDGFLDQLNRRIHELRGLMDVIKPELVIHLSYRLENDRTGILLKTDHITGTIKDPTFYTDSECSEGNAILISNYCDTINKAIPRRVYGSELLRIRLTGYKLFYNVVRLPAQTTAYVRHDKPHASMREIYSSGPIITELHDDKPKHNELTDRFRWDGRSLYHFESEGTGIKLHQNEINSESSRLFRILVASESLNKSFVANGSQRIRFNISAWNCDTIAVSNTRKVYEVITMSTGFTGNYTNCHPPQHPILPQPSIPDFELMKMLYDLRTRVDIQEHIIGELNAKMTQAETKIATLEASIIELKAGAAEEASTGGGDLVLPSF
jgi:hypothetical protein